MADAFLALKRMHVFAQLDEKGVKTIAPHFQEVNVKTGDIIFEEGDLSDFFYTIDSGEVEILTGFASNKVRRLSTLRDGDYFGEMGLAKHTTRNATVRALQDTRFWRIANDKFNALMLQNPKVRKALEVAIQTRQYARQEKFHKWLRENEIVYLVTLPHKVFLLPMIGRPVLLLTGGFILALIIFFMNFSLVWQLLPLCIIVLGSVWFYWNWVDFHNDWYIVTSQRVIDIEKVVLFYESRAEAPLVTVQNTTINTDEWGRQLDYGDVTVSTFSGPIKFHNIPHPQAVSDLILEQINRVRVQQKVTERNVLKGSLRTAMGLDQAPPPPPPPPITPKKQPGLANQWNNFWKQIHFRVREQQGEIVTYRKHPLMLFQELAAQLGGVVIILILYILSIINVFGKWLAVDSNILLIGWAGLLLPLGYLIWNIGYEYVDWRNDIYMLTPTQIFDIERKPFGAEQRKAANIEAISNVSFLRPDFLAYMFNYGTVTVVAGPGGEMKFFNVFDPLSVQQDIYRRKEAREQMKAVAATKARLDEYAQYFGAFYEILEDERKKKGESGNS